MVGPLREAMGKRIELVLPGETLPEFSDVAIGQNEKDEWRDERAQVTRDGTEIIVESRWTRVRDERGQPYSTTGRQHGYHRKEAVGKGTDADGAVIAPGRVGSEPRA